MPAVGDQHNNAPANPFEEAKPRISEYTAKELAVLQGRLQQQLGPEFISTRKGPGGKNVHYIASDKVIGLANSVFGFNGWSSTIRDIQVDFVDENVQTKKVDVGLSVIVRVTLRDGTHHEDVGYGHIENCSGKAAAFEKAKKEGTTDALKRTLRNFGNVLGNCVYDKDYLGKVTKIKVRPTRFAEENLYRHADFAPQKSEPEIQAGKPANPVAEAAVIAPAQDTSTTVSLSESVPNEGEVDFSSADFDDADFSFSEFEHPDAMVVETKPPADQLRTNMHPGAANRPPMLSTNNRTHSVPPPRPQTHADAVRQAQPTRPPVNPQHHSAHLQAQRPPMNQTQSTGNIGRPVNSRPGPPQPPNPSVPNISRPVHGSPSGPQSRPQRPGAVSGAPAQANTPASRPSNAPVAESFGNMPSIPGEQPIPAGAPQGFVQGRNAELAQKAKEPIPSFNPKAETPSIRRTAGFDHTRSAKAQRTTVPWKSPGDLAAPGAQPDVTKRIGAPMPHNSPLANRNQFRPVGKRPAEGDAQQAQRAEQGPAANANKDQGDRQILADVTAGVVNSAASGLQSHAGPDAKRPKLGNESASATNNARTAASTENAVK